MSTQAINALQRQREYRVTMRLIASVRQVLDCTARHAGTGYSARGVWMRAFRGKHSDPYDHFAIFEEMRKAMNAAAREYEFPKRRRR